MNLLRYSRSRVGDVKSREFSVCKIFLAFTLGMNTTFKMASGWGGFHLVDELHFALFV